jgi:hypothetical protein
MAFTTLIDDDIAEISHMPTEVIGPSMVLPCGVEVATDRGSIWSAAVAPFMDMKAMFAGGEKDEIGSDQYAVGRFGKSHDALSFMSFCGV